VTEKPMLVKQLSFARAWLSHQLGVVPTPDRTSLAGRFTFPPGPPFTHRLITGAVIFFVALGIRILIWQDIQPDLRNGNLIIVDSQYKTEARRIQAEGGLVFPREHKDSGDAQMLMHPPGYSILLLALYGEDLTGHLYERLRWVQVILDAFATALVFVIAAELLPFVLAVLAGSIAALSPHLAFYSLYGTPDSLSVPPILLSIYLVIRAIKRPRLVTIAAAGAMIGLSCWLRANALLLAPVLAVVVWLLVERSKRLRYAFALVCATIMVIAPITIRNWMVFHTFVPLSLTSGVNLVEGIANYDKDDRFGMPKDHRAILKKDAEWHGRPDYGFKTWRPDGIKRDRERFARGLAVIRSNPDWFLGVMIRRAAFMLKYNSSGTKDWPENTATVRSLSSRPLFNHPLSLTSDTHPVWSSSAFDLMTNGEVISRQAKVSIIDGGEALRIVGDSSDFRDVFASAPIDVEKDTDYLLTLPAMNEQGSIGVKVTSVDRGTSLGTGTATSVAGMIKQQEEETDTADVDESDKTTDSAGEQAMNLIRIPFATGADAQVRLVLSNNGAASSLPAARLGSPEVFALGPTPYAWTRPFRAIIRAIQKNVFTTTTMLPLVIEGIGLLALAGHRGALLILLAVPVYYVGAHSILYTEYRYIIAIHYFLFIAAATTLYCVSAGIWEAGRSTVALRARRNAREESSDASGN
jgi:hypothetical protein